MARKPLEPTRFHVGADYIDMRAELEKAEANFVDLYAQIGGGSDDDTAYATTAAMTTALAAKAATADLSSIALAANTDIGMPNDGDVIHFDIGTGKWTRGAPSGGGVQDRMFVPNPPTAAQFALGLAISHTGGSSDTTPPVLTENPTRTLVHDPEPTGRGFKAFMRTIPSGLRAGNAFEFAMRFDGYMYNQYCGMTLVLADDAGNFKHFRKFVNNNGWLAVSNDHGDTSGAWYDGTVTGLNTDPKWMKIGYDASGNMIFHVSQDGYSWSPIISGDTLGSLAPTRYGWGPFKYNSGPTDFSAVSWFSTELPLAY